MSQHFPVLIVLLPLSAALLSPLFSYLHRQAGKWIAILSLFGAFLCSVGLLLQVVANGGEAIHYWMGDWMPPLGIEFVVDPINGVIVTMITFVALCSAIYSTPFLKKNNWLYMGGYYTLMALLCVGLSGMTLTGDAFNLYVYLEIASLSGYGLIALGGNKGTLAAFRYLLIGTIAASLYLLALGFMYSMTGSLNMADLSVLLQDKMDSPLIIMSIALLIAAFGIKAALFPFHGWQPDAYTYSHPGAAPLISGVMSKVPAYAMLRFFFYLFGAQHLFVQHGLTVVGILGALGIILGSVMAIAQDDFRRMLAYSSVAQIGYIGVGLAIGSFYGLIGAVLHIINHAFMKGSLFMVIGGVRYRFGEVSISKLGQIGKKMPFTVFTLVVAALAMIGIPPTGGFFSKWYIMLGAMQTEQYIYVAVLVISSLLNAVYFFRVLENVFINPDPGLKELNPPTGKLELPLQMLIPIVVFGIAILALGFCNEMIVDGIIKLGLPEVFVR
ncbi:MAG: complex I subunit 5 family protein [Peptococcaceae bacterium]